MTMDEPLTADAILDAFAAFGRVLPTLKPAADQWLEIGLVLLARIKATVRNPFRGIGREDPGFCGSGKTFKTCCLDKVM
jgi:hypothetical protein